MGEWGMEEDEIIMIDELQYCVIRHEGVYRCGGNNDVIVFGFDIMTVSTTTDVRLARKILKTRACRHSK